MFRERSWNGAREARNLGTENFERCGVSTKSATDTNLFRSSARVALAWKNSWAACLSWHISVGQPGKHALMNLPTEPFVAATKMLSLISKAMVFACWAHEALCVSKKFATISVNAAVGWQRRKSNVTLKSTCACRTMSRDASSSFTSEESIPFHALLLILMSSCAKSGSFGLPSRNSTVHKPQSTHRETLDRARSDAFPFSGRTDAVRCNPIAPENATSEKMRA
mmetsp:Transcript_42001/g.115937  ORF Transcript_42001/g.115937 Transcript_42001/m.115937 type:complete len:224 (+) Transcript_42001:836-1507(+)